MSQVSILCKSMRLPVFNNLLPVLYFPLMTQTRLIVTSFLNFQMMGATMITVLLMNASIL
jgi:hypothetical protein